MRAALCLSVLALCGCVRERNGAVSSEPTLPSRPTQVGLVGEASTAQVYRVDDDERGVTCYVAVSVYSASSGATGGIHCVSRHP